MLFGAGDNTTSRGGRRAVRDQRVSRQVVMKVFPTRRPPERRRRREFVKLVKRASGVNGNPSQTIAQKGKPMLLPGYGPYLISRNL